MHQQINKTRRSLLLAGGFGICSLPAFGVDRLFTPSQTAGPFYPNLPMLDDDSDLTRISGETGIADGVITDLSGRIVASDGKALDGIRIEIWQCDANGRYRHTRERRSIPMDPHFQGFGHSITDKLGRYRFRTIRPVPYPGRTPHIHAAIFRPGMKPFVTQIYVAGDPGNIEDNIFRRIPVEQRPLAVADFTPSRKEGVDMDAEFDFILST